MKVLKDTFQQSQVCSYGEENKTRAQTQTYSQVHMQAYLHAHIGTNIYTQMYPYTHRLKKFYLN